MGGAHTPFPVPVGQALGPVNCLLPEAIPGTSRQPCVCVFGGGVLSVISSQGALRSPKHGALILDWAHLAMWENIFACHNWEGWYWHPVGRVLGC